MATTKALRKQPDPPPTPTPWDEAWALFLRDPSKGTTTRRNYVTYAKKIDAFRAKNGISHPDQFTDEMELDFLDSIPGAKSTRWTYQKTLRAFFNWCRPRGRRGVVALNARISTPSTELPITDLDWSKFQQAMAAASPRDRMMIELGAVTGMRSSELRNLKVEQWQQSTHSIVWPEKKTDDWRVITVPEEVAKHMSRYLRETRPQTSAPWFFVTQRRGPDGEYGQLTRSAINSLFRRLRDDLGWEVRTLSPQILRRTFANTMLSETGDIFKVMSIGGWKDQRSLQRYLARHVETDKAVMEGAWQRLKGDKS